MDTNIRIYPVKKRLISWILIVAALLIILSVIIILALTTGEMEVSLTDLSLLWADEGQKDELTRLLIREIRLPRVLLGLAVGGSLSLSGVILQGIYRNPLVEPYTLGISGGASLGVAAVIVLGLPSVLGSFILPVSGFIGALAIIILVYWLGTGRGHINIRSMLLTGVMISFIASSGMMFLMSITSAENLQGIIFWIMGSLDEPDTGLILMVLITSLVSLLLSYLFARPLNALRLGEEKARHLGIRTDIVIRLLFLLASLLAGICVAVAGVIGFVGLIIPHVLRLVLGTDYRILLVASYLLGGSFIILSDMLARTIISPNELPIGVITGLIGGLSFIILMTRKQHRI